MEQRQFLYTFRAGDSRRIALLWVTQTVLELDSAPCSHHYIPCTQSGCHSEAHTAKLYKHSTDPIKVLQEDRSIETIDE